MKAMTILELNNIAMSFGGLNVFSGINLSVEENQIHGIIGTNGAGKTTLFNIICGFYRPTLGRVYLEGKDITCMQPWQIARIGIGRCFQLVMPFNSLTPYENSRVARSMAGKFCGEREKFSLDEIMELTGLKDKMNVITANLSLPDKKNTEIARALACNSKLLLFDEVSCGLSGDEIYARMELMRKIASYGTTIIVIEHIMMFIKEICDVVSVLHSGSIICEGPPSVVAQDVKVIEAYLGGRKK